MINTLKHYKISHLWQFMLVLILSTLSCETEQLDPQIIEDADQSSRLIYQKKTTSDVLSNPQLFTQIQKINAAKPSLYSKNQDINNTIVIDIKNANYAEKANGHSYTFPIVSDDPGAKLTNVVFNYNKAGEYIPVLVNYPFTYGEMQRMTKKALDALPVEMQLLDPEHITTNQSKNFGYTCFNNYTLVCEQGLPEYCNGTDAEWILESVECYNTGPGPDSGFPFNGGGGFESVTIPINVNINYASAINLIVGQHNFTQEEKDWLNDPVNDIKVENIFNNILVAGEHTNDVRDLAVQIIKYIVSNKGTNETTAVKHMDQIASLLKENNFTDEAITLTEDMINLLDKGNAKQKRFVNAILDKNISQALNIAIEGAQFQQCCDEYDVSTKMAWFTAKLVFDFHDGMHNLVQMTEDIFNSDKEEGKFIKVIMENSGVTVPADVSDETLGRLFKVRYEGGELTYRPTGEWYTPFVDAAVTFLDIVAVLAPSSNGGAFLVIKGGGTITSKALSDYLKILAKGKWKTVNESMSDAAKSYQELISGKKWNESFEMPGPVKFDGIKNAVFVEAKSGMLNFVNANGNFKPFFTGKDAILSQAQRQRAAAGNLPVEWHFEHDIVRQAFENLLKNEGLDIIFIHTPR